MNTPVVRLRCGHCRRVLRIAYLQGSDWEVHTIPVGHASTRLVNGLIRADKRLTFTCKHRDGKARTIPLRHDTLQRLCAEAIASPRREVLL